MIATYENRHVLVSNSYTKSALRCAGDEVASARPNISYFPSYEMCTGSVNGAQYYNEDQRTISQTGINVVMKLFFDHYTEGKASRRSNVHALKIDVARESAEAAKVVCDEEAIEAA